MSAASSKPWMSASPGSRRSWRRSGRRWSDPAVSRKSARSPTRSGNRRAEMSLAPDSVWLDARGTQSAAHGERGVARYVAEHTTALLDAAPEAIGAIGLDRGVPIPPSMQALEGSGLISWHTSTRTDGPPLPAIYHVMSPFEMTMTLEEIWPVWIRRGEARVVVTLYDLIPLVMRE